MYVTFINFKVTFDFLNHNIIFNKLQGIGVSPKIIHLIKTFYVEGQMQVKQKTTNKIESLKVFYKVKFKTQFYLVYIPLT